MLTLPDEAADTSSPARPGRHTGAGAILASVDNVPVIPPHAWFARPEPDGPQALTFYDDGSVAGHVACWGVCHVGFPGTCRTAPRSPSRYAHYHVGELRTTEGRVAVGPLTVRGPHADTRASVRQARDTYADSSLVVARLRLADGDHGIWACGALCPNVDEALLQEAMASVPSGDWRWINGNLEMIHVHQVPTGGFSTPRALVAHADDADEVLALVAGGAYQPCEPCEVRALSGRALGRDKLIELALR